MSMPKRIWAWNQMGAEWTDEKPTWEGTEICEYVRADTVAPEQEARVWNEAIDAVAAMFRRGQEAEILAAYAEGRPIDDLFDAVVRDVESLRKTAALAAADRGGSK